MHEWLDIKSKQHTRRAGRGRVHCRYDGWNVIYQYCKQDWPGQKFSPGHQNGVFRRQGPHVPYKLFGLLWCWRPGVLFALHKRSFVFHKLPANHVILKLKFPQSWQLQVRSPDFPISQHMCIVKKTLRVQAIHEPMSKLRSQHGCISNRIYQHRWEHPHFQKDGYVVLAGVVFVQVILKIDSNFVSAWGKVAGYRPRARCGLQEAETCLIGFVRKDSNNLHKKKSTYFMTGIWIAQSLWDIAIAILAYIVWIPVCSQYQKNGKHNN